MICKWQSEIDPFCNKVLTKHWPKVRRYGDIKEIGKHNLEPVDLICGGFPCQPFSVAGKQRGKEDDRYLWPEMLRVIAEVKPTYVIGENVTGIINMELDKVLSDLESQGYETQTLIIPACAVDAPHRRDRVWILAYNSQSRTGVEIHRSCGQRGQSTRTLESEILRQENGQIGSERIDASCEDVADASCELFNRAGEARNRRRQPTNGSCKKRNATDAQRIYDDSTRHGTSEDSRQQSGQTKILRNGCKWLPESDVGRVVARFSSTLDEAIKDFGYENADYQEAIAKIDTARRSILRKMWSSQRKVESTSYGHESGCRDDSMYEMSCLRTHERWKLGQWIKKDKELCDLWERICAKPFQETQDLQQRMLERIRTHECNEKVASSRVDRLRSLGNAVVPQVVEVIGRAIMEIERNRQNDSRQPEKDR